MKSILAAREWPAVIAIDLDLTAERFVADPLAVADYIGLEISGVAFPMARSRFSDAATIKSKSAVIELNWAKSILFSINSHPFEPAS